jgi:hypothetical protein
MEETNPRGKCCTPQHFPTGYPTTEWTPEELSAYAQAQHHAILDDERKLAAKYWRLGMALNLLRNNFDHGQWQRLLSEWNIEKTKASRARAIARTFQKEEELAGLTVRQAYDKRVRKQRKSRSKEDRRAVGSDRLGRFLDHVAKTAEYFIDDAGFAEEAQATILLPAVDEAISKLVHIRDLLAASSTQGRKSSPP